MFFQENGLVSCITPSSLCSTVSSSLAAAIADAYSSSRTFPLWDLHSESTEFHIPNTQTQLNERLLLILTTDNVWGYFNSWGEMINSTAISAEVGFTLVLAPSALRKIFLDSEQSVAKKTNEFTVAMTCHHSLEWLWQKYCILLTLLPICMFFSEPCTTYQLPLPHKNKSHTSTL